MAKYVEGQRVYLFSDPDEFEWTIDSVDETDWNGNPLSKARYDLVRYDDGSYYSPSHTKWGIDEYEIHPMNLATRLRRIEEALNLDD